MAEMMSGKSTDTETKKKYKKLSESEQALFDKEVKRAGVKHLFRDFLEKNILFSAFFNAVKSFNQGVFSELSKSPFCDAIKEAFQNRKNKKAEDKFKKRNAGALASIRRSKSKFLCGEIGHAISWEYENLHADMMLALQEAQKIRNGTGIYSGFNAEARQKISGERMMGLISQGMDYDKETGRYILSKSLDQDINKVLNVLNTAMNEGWDFDTIKTAIDQTFDSFSYRPYKQALDRIRREVQRKIDFIEKNCIPRKEAEMCM